MMRGLFLWLAHNRTLRRFMESSRLSRKFTTRFIPGETVEAMLTVSQELAREGFLVTADRLGENVTRIEEAAAARDASVATLEALARFGIGATFSVKLTQFGLDVSEAGCLENMRVLVAQAKQLGTRIEIDMESTAYTDRTLKILRTLHTEFGAVRAVIQAYLKRTAKDIEEMCALGIPVRLCKGAYDEPPGVAMADKADVDANYIAQSRVLLESGKYPALATHDPRMIAAVLDQVRSLGLHADRFEFQMLYGIRRDLQQQLVKQGWRVRLYVPYGDAWYPYFMRRLAERPANVLFLLRNLFRS